MTAMKLEFYYTTTTCSLASHIGLEEAGPPFEASFVKLYREESIAIFLFQAFQGFDVACGSGNLITAF